MLLYLRHFHTTASAAQAAVYNTDFSQYKGNTSITKESERNKNLLLKQQLSDFFFSNGSSSPFRAMTSYSVP
jgi:tmRNA-binding protein